MTERESDTAILTEAARLLDRAEDHVAMGKTMEGLHRMAQDGAREQLDALSDAVEAGFGEQRDTLEETLYRQARILDRAFMNLADPDKPADDRGMSMMLALKAQLQFRRTLETLDRMRIKRWNR